MCIRERFWLDIRLIRYDFAQTPEMLRRLWYAYYIPMLLIPTLALSTLFFLDRGQSAPLYTYRSVIFVFPVVLFSLVLKMCIRDSHSTYRNN